jgi:DNA-binding beta-propeller fold protein YncE
MLRSTSLWLLIGILVLAGCSSQEPVLLRPNGVVLAKDGSLFVMDRGNYRVAHLAASGKLLGSIGSFGTQAQNIHFGWDLEQDTAGNLYFTNLVYDPEGSSVIHDGVKEFAPDGTFLRELGASDYNPDAEPPPHTPYALEVDAEDRLYIPGFTTNILRVFSSKGDLIGTFFGTAGSADGEFRGLTDVAVDDRRGWLYAVDTTNSRIQQFRLVSSIAGSLTLTYERSVGTYGTALGQFAYPQYVAVDQASGRWYVSDMGNERIQAFSADGTPLFAFAPPDISRWQVLGINVGPDGAIYAADAFNNLIWVFAPDGSLRSRIEVQP